MHEFQSLSGRAALLAMALASGAADLAPPMLAVADLPTTPVAAAAPPPRVHSVHRVRAKSVELPKAASKPVLVSVPAWVPSKPAIPGAPMQQTTRPAPAPVVSAPPSTPPSTEASAPSVPILGAPIADAPSIVATASDLQAGMTGTAAFLPFTDRVGAAAFRRNGVAWIVFDQRHQIDLTALQDNPVFSQAVVQILPKATLLRLPLEEGSELRLTHGDGGWIIAALRGPPPTPSVNVAVKSARFELAAAGPSDVVTVPDMETGQNLLVGTLRGAPASVPVARRVPAFVLEPSWFGVVVEPIADTVTLRVTPDGFALGAGSEALSPTADAASALADAAFLTRRFDIPTGSPESLERRLQTQIREAGDAPAQSRAKPRKAAATIMIALGMGLEAQGMLALAAEEDPRLISDADSGGLSAIAAMLGGRPAETDGILNPALDGSDEVAFWRAIRAAQAHTGAPEAAPVFAATVNLLLAYPPTLRIPLLPLVVETMALGGAGAAADVLLARLKDDTTLDLARAIRQEAMGNTADALTRYDAIAAGRDRLAAARAATRATDLRLRTKAITPADAVKAFENQFYDWRGDERELDLRLRVAAMKAELGEWRPALALLRETATLYPDSNPLIQVRMADLMTTLIQGPASATISPLELVSLTEENAELVAMIGTSKVAGLMADKLLALDLPRRAGPVLEKMLAAAPVGAGQATLGVRLATLRLGEGDVAGAEAALANSNAPGLPTDLIARRGLISARIAARTGHLERARSILLDINTPPADDLRASLLTDAQDWRGAASALMDLVAKTVNSDGALSPAQQDTLLRLASALSRAGDTAGLVALGAKYGSRIEGPRSGMFRLLTAPPVSNVADLPRSSTEVALAKAIPVGLTAMGGR
jgi:hypothetical protein